MSLINMKREMSDALHCVICIQKAVNPHLCPKCSKLSCFRCISQWITLRNTCPSCLGVLNQSVLIKCRWAEDLSQDFDRMFKALEVAIEEKDLLDVQNREMAEKMENWIPHEAEKKAMPVGEGKQHANGCVAMRQLEDAMWKLEKVAKQMRLKLANNRTGQDAEPLAFDDQVEAFSGLTEKLNLCKIQLLQ